MAYDYIAAPPPRDLDLIPAGTIASVQLRIRPGGVGEGKLLKRSPRRLRDARLELVVVDGPHAKRKFWANMILAGTTGACPGSRYQPRTFAQHPRVGTRDQARRSQRAGARQAHSRPQRLRRHRFIAKIGIEKGKPKNDGSGENYPDKNHMAAVITPDKKEWHQVAQCPSPFDGSERRGGGFLRNSPASIKKPVWA